MENDSYYAVHASIELAMSGPELTDAYHTAFPSTGKPMEGCKRLHISDLMPPSTGGVAVLYRGSQSAEGQTYTTGPT